MATPQMRRPVRMMKRANMLMKKGAATGNSKFTRRATRLQGKIQSRLNSAVGL